MCFLPNACANEREKRRRAKNFFGRFRFVRKLFSAGNRRLQLNWTTYGHFSVASNNSEIIAAFIDKTCNGREHERSAAFGFEPKASGASVPRSDHVAWPIFRFQRLERSQRTHIRCKRTRTKPSKKIRKRNLCTLRADEMPKLPPSNRTKCVCKMHMTEQCVSINNFGANRKTNQTKKRICEIDTRTDNLVIFWVIRSGPWTIASGKWNKKRWRLWRWAFECERER